MEVSVQKLARVLFYFTHFKSKQYVFVFPGWRVTHLRPWQGVGGQAEVIQGREVENKG